MPENRNHLAGIGLNGMGCGGVNLDRRRRVQRDTRSRVPTGFAFWARRQASDQRKRREGPRHVPLIFGSPPRPPSSVTRAVEPTGVPRPTSAGRDERSRGNQNLGALRDGRAGHLGIARWCEPTCVHGRLPGQCLVADGGSTAGRARGIRRRPCTALALRQLPAATAATPRRGGCCCDAAPQAQRVRAARPERQGR